MAEQPGRWPRWATALCLLLGSSLLSALCFAIFVGPHWGEPAQFRNTVGANPNAPEEARVTTGDTNLTAVPGETVTLTWEVTNTGESTWAVDVYHFVPEGDGAPVLSLPKRVAPGETVAVRADLIMPPDRQEWDAVWHLKGRRGEVRGGALRVRLTAAAP